jgi:hypothetical protein
VNPGPDSGSSDDAVDSKRQDGVIFRLGWLEVDVPRSIGYFGGIGLAVCAGALEPPLGLAIAAVPLIKMLNLARAPIPSRFVGQILEGMALPIGGDSQGTIRLVTPMGPSDEPVD